MKFPLKFAFCSTFTSSSRKTLFHRLGGEPMMFKSLQLFYNKAQADSVLIKYIRNIEYKKVIDHQKRILMVAFGGTPGITLENIMASHKKLNISDNDFDVMKLLVKETFEQLNIQRDLIEESLELIEEYRKLIVADSIYQQMGEDVGMKKLVDFQFDKILEDPELRHFFLTSNIDKVKANIMLWLTKSFGGSDKCRGLDLKEIHKNLEIDDRHFFLFKRHLAYGFYKCGATSAVIDKALDTIEKDRNSVLGLESTFVILGEDIGLRQIVNAMLKKAMNNPMLKPFFNAENFDRISEGFYNFLAKELGNTNKNKEPPIDLKLIHSKLNLTDMHLDALQSMMEQTLAERFTPKMVIRDVLWSMDRYRRKVCYINIYEMLGGNTFIQNAAERMQKKLKFHYRLAIFFKNYNDEQLTQLMKHLLTYSVGGRRAYRGRDLLHAHENLGIKYEHFLDMRHLVKQTFKEMGVVDSLILQVLRVYDDKKRWVVFTEKEEKKYFNPMNEDVVD